MKPSLFVLLNKFFWS